MRLGTRVRNLVRFSASPSAAVSGDPGLIGLQGRLHSERLQRRSAAQATARFGLKELLFSLELHESATEVVGASHFKGSEIGGTEHSRWQSEFAAENVVDDEFLARREYALEELTCFRGPHFVEVAFRALLKRPSDATGFTHFLGRLQEGSADRIDILAALRLSGEGRRRNVLVGRLRWLSFWRRARRTRFVGPPMAWAHSLVRLPRLVRQYQILESRVELDRQRRESLSAQLTEFSRSTSSSFDSLNVQLTESSRGVSSSLSGLDEEGHLLQRAVDRLDRRLQSRPWKEEIVGVVSEQQVLSDALRRTTDEQQRLAITLSAVPSEQAALLRRVEQRLREELQGVQASLLDAANRLGNEATIASDRLSQIEALGNARDEHLADVGRSLAPLVQNFQREQFSPDESRSLEDFYDGLEARFRGARAEIKTRFTPYLDILRQANAGTIERPVIDLGCGRGEWLEVLHDNHLHAYGIDISETAVKQCLDLGLVAECHDVLNYLSATKAASFGAVSAMHMVEHLPFKTLVVLIREIRRVLLPGGLLIFETPNPENLFVAAYAFRMDPTHRAPLPPPLLEYLIESQGFAELSVLRLNAGAYGDPFANAPRSDTATDSMAATSITSLLATIVQQNFYSAPDFAVVARRPLDMLTHHSATASSQ